MELVQHTHIHTQQDAKFLYLDDILHTERWDAAPPYSFPFPLTGVHDVIMHTWGGMPSS